MRKNKPSALSSQLSARGRGTRPRILAGRWRGRALEVPRGARPTSSRAREALFDILQNSISGARVLELFAGSGAVGLEALSRGARETVFVEKDTGALEKSLVRLGAGKVEATVVAGEAREIASLLARRGERFDLVFADPPYEIGRSALSRSIGELLLPGGRLVLQTDSNASVPRIGGLDRVARRAYGRNVFWFFERAET